MLDLEVTLKKTLTPYSPPNKPKFAPFTVKKGQRVRFDDHRNELIVVLPNDIVRRVRISKADV